MNEGIHFGNIVPMVQISRLWKERGLMCETCNVNGGL